MAQAYRLDLQALVKKLGLREMPGPGWADVSELGLGLTLPLEEVQSGPATATPTPTPQGGLEPSIIIRTGVESVAASATDSGVLNVFGAGLVSGVDPVNKGSSHASPPTAEWELWGAIFFHGKERVAIFDLEHRIQRTSGIAITDEILLAANSDQHSTNAWNERMHIIMLPRPYRLGAGQQLFYFWSMANLEAVIRTAALNCRLLWKYS